MKDTAHLRGFGRLSTLLVAQGVKPSQAKWFQDFVSKLMKSRGPKGALLYLDSLGNQIGAETIGWSPETSSPTWVRRSTIAFFKQTKNKHLLRRLTKIKRHIMVSKPTPEQVQKFLGSACREAPDEVAMHMAGNLVQNGIRSMWQYFPKKRVCKPKNAHIAYVKRELSRGLAPNIAISKAMSRLQEDLICLHNQGYFHDEHYATMIYHSLEPLVRHEVDRLRTAKVLGTVRNADTVGTLCGTQEPGMKLRVFASPRLIIQCLLEPLKEWFMTTLQAIENDGCFDQEACVSKILDWMQDVDCVKYSLDLQNATDRFPAKLSYIAMAAMPDYDVHQKRLFREVSNSKWHVHDDLAEFFGCSDITWTVGQPLGTGPSFGAFSVAHHALVRGLCLHLHVPFSKYVMLGDDICIKDPVLAKEYKSIMERIGVPISSTKSVVSNSLAEFAGSTITCQGAFRPGKWREVTSESLLSFIRDPGYDYKRVVPPFWVPLIERMQQIPYPYGLRVPDFTSMTFDDKYFYAVDLFQRFVVNLAAKGETGKLGEFSGLHDDSSLLRLYFQHSLALDHIYEAQHAFENEQRAKRFLDNDRQQAIIRTRFTLRRAIGTYNPEGSFGAAFWMQLSWMHGTPSKVRDQSHTCDRSRREASRLLKQYGAAVSLMKEQHPDVESSVEGLGSFLISFITSLTEDNFTWMGGETAFVNSWIQCVPLLRDYYKNSVKEPSAIDVIKDAISVFPFYSLSDFAVAPQRFISLIRRYGRNKDVLPSLRPPMPHKK